MLKYITSSWCHVKNIPLMKHKAGVCELVCKDSEILELTTTTLSIKLLKSLWHKVPNDAQCFACRTLCGVDALSHLH